MKKSLAIIAAISILSACSSNSLESKKQALEKLKQQETELKEKIAALETEIGNNGVSTENQKIKQVALTSIELKPFNSYIEIQGKIDAEENISAGPEMPGTVAKIYVKVGENVSKGQVMAELDSRTLQQGLAELKSGLDFAKEMFNKQKNLWDQKIGTEVQYLQAKNQKESLEKKLATLEEQIRMTKIISPIQGVVDAVDIKVGQATAPGAPGIRVVNLNKLKIKAEVAESYSSRVKKGNEALLIFPDLGDTIKTQIDHVAKVINPMTRTFSVEINLQEKDIYRPNMIAVLKIIDYQNPKAVSIPVNIIQKTEKGNYVFVESAKKAKKINVNVGKIYNGQAEILTGLNPGDKIISTGFQDLNEGENVNFSL
jgi:membrane fusion protein (multidrug efflux system)